MADIQVTGLAHAALENRQALAGPFWADSSNGVILYVDNGSDISSAYTDDGGATWTLTEIEAGTCKRLDCWFDEETPGITGDTVHTAWLDTSGDLKYVAVNASDGTSGTIRTVDNTLTVSSTDNLNRLAITKTKSGNVIIAGSTQTELFAYKSSDQYATAGTSIADPYETTTEEDWGVLYPANTTDDADACIIFQDRSANELSIKMYDDSANTWTETSISTGIVEDIAYQNLDAAVRASDGKILAVAHSDADSTGDDLLTWEINPNSISSPTVTAKTNVFTNQSESAQAAIMIDNNTDDVYIAYIKGGTWLSSTDIVYHKSTDDMATWGTEQAYTETSRDYRMVTGGRSIKSGQEGFIQWATFDDDSRDIFVNTVNDEAITAGSDYSLTATGVSSASSVGTPAITQAHDLTGTGVSSASSVDSPALTQLHDLTASGISSASSVGSPAITQVHDLTATGISSASEVGTPALSSDSIALTADSISSASSVGSPALTQVHDLTGSGVSSASSVGSPVLTQVHSLGGTGISSASEVGTPALTVVVVLVADSITSGSSVGSPTLTQVHTLTPTGISSTSSVGSPQILGGEYEIAVANSRIRRKSVIDGGIDGAKKAGGEIEKLPVIAGNISNKTTTSNIPSYD